MMTMKKGALVILLPLMLLFSGCGSGAGAGLLSLAAGILGGNEELFDNTGDDNSTIVVNNSSDDGGDADENGDSGNDPPALAHTPEPGSLLLFGTGLLGSALWRSTKRKFLNKRKLRKVR